MILKARSLLAILCVLLVCGCSSGGGSDDPDNPGGDPTPVNTVKTPTFNNESGSYSFILPLTMSCETAGATIHYTLDGSAPTVDSPTYTGIIPILDEKTVKAIAVKDGMNISSVKSAEYEFHYYGRNDSWDGGAYYYLDGVKQHLTMPSGWDGFTSRGIYKSNTGDMYVFGFLYNDEDNQPCYWMNGTYHALGMPENGDGGTVNYGYTVFDGKLYIPGFVYIEDEEGDDYKYPCYWKGDECVILDDYDGETSDGIYVTADGDVFIAGTYRNNDGDYEPVCWKNTTRLDMEISEGTEGVALGVFVSGSDLYVSGMINGTPCYWKNTHLVELDVPDFSLFGTITGANTNAMRVLNDDVFVGGTCTLIKEIGTFMTPMYWKNGVATILQIPGKPDARGGVWGFRVCDNMAIPCGEWDSATAYGEFCVINDTVYFTERSQ